MKPLLKLVAFILLTGILFYVSCKKEYSCENCKGNKPPISNAGPDQVITLPTDSVSLDGSSSSDPDGTISGYLWAKISGPASFTIIQSSDSITKVKSLITGTYQFELKVTDNDGLSAKDTMRIIVDPGVTTNHPPIANAGADQTITLPTNTINLDGGGSTDPDNNITNYLWTKISGPFSFNIAYANAIQTQVNNLATGVYLFELKVTDAGGLFSKDTIQVTVNPETPSPPPICDPGARPLINAQLVPFGTLAEGRINMAIASAGNKILFAGGWPNPNIGATSTVDIYDIVTQNWSTAALSQARLDMAVVVSGNKIFFAGGADIEMTNTYGTVYSNVDIYDASTNTWSVSSLSKPRRSMAAAAVDNKVFFAGGDPTYNRGTGNGVPPCSNIVDIYDLSTNSWSAATLSQARYGLTATTVGNKIYFAGGNISNDIFPLYSNIIDIYDDATGSWSISTLNEPRTHLSAIALDGKIYWAGGRNATGFSSQVEIRNVNTQTSSLACLFQPNGWGWNVNAVVQKDNKIVFFTGSGAVTNKFDIYDFTTNIWSIGLLNLNIRSATIISVNNTIYVAGGYLNGAADGATSNQVYKLEF